MKVIICGAGRVGRTLAQWMCQHNEYVVTVIEENRVLAEKIEQDFDVTVQIGLSSDPLVLKQAIGQGCDILLAVTHCDEVNMMTCKIAALFFGNQTRILRLRNSSYFLPQYSTLFSASNVPADLVISTEQEIATIIQHALDMPGTQFTEAFCKGQVYVTGLSVKKDTLVEGKPIQEIHALYPDVVFSIHMIAKEKDHQFTYVSEKDSLEAHDKIVLIYPLSHMSRIMSIFGYSQTHMEHVIFIGGGAISTAIIEKLHRRSPKTYLTIVEKQEEQVDKLLEHLYRHDIKNHKILKGDVMNESIMGQIPFDKSSVVLALTDEDKINILVASLAKSLGVEKSLAIINHKQQYRALVDSLGIDVVINPQDTISSAILRHIKRGHIQAIFPIPGEDIYILSAVIASGSSLVGENLSVLEGGKNFRLCGLYRDKLFMALSEGLLLEKGDHLLLSCKKEAMKSLERTLSPTTEYF